MGVPLRLASLRSHAICSLVSWMSFFSMVAYLRGIRRKQAMKTAMIYVLLDPSDWAVCYVGSTVKGLPVRLRGHLYTKNKKMARWIRSLRADGLAPEIRLVDVCDIADRFRCESDWICHYIESGRALFNKDALTMRLIRERKISVRY